MSRQGMAQRRTLLEDNQMRPLGGEQQEGVEGSFYFNTLDPKLAQGQLTEKESDFLHNTNLPAAQPDVSLNQLLPITTDDVSFIQSHQSNNFEINTSKRVTKSSCMLQKTNPTQNLQDTSFLKTYAAEYTQTQSILPPPFPFEELQFPSKEYISKSTNDQTKSINFTAVNAQLHQSNSNSEEQEPGNQNLKCDSRSYGCDKANIFMLNPQDSQALEPLSLNKIIISPYDNELDQEPRKPKSSFWKISNTQQETIDESQQKGSFKDVILKTPVEFVQQMPQTVNAPKSRPANYFESLKHQATNEFFGSNFNLNTANKLEKFNSNNNNINNDSNQYLAGNSIKSPEKKSSPWLVFGRTRIIRKFARNILSRSSIYSFRHLSRSQFEMQDDVASDFGALVEAGFVVNQVIIFYLGVDFLSYFFLIFLVVTSWKQQRNISSFWLKFKAELLSKILSNDFFIILPDSMISIIWEFLTMILWIGIIFYTPVRINFSQFTENQHQLDGFQLFILLLFIVETLVKLNKAVFRRGLIITSREQIIRDYLKTDAYLDFFMFAVYSFSHRIQHYGYLEYVLELRLLRVIKTYKETFQKLDQGARHNILRRVSLLFFTVLAFINLQGSIFVKLGIQENHKAMVSTGDTNNFDTYVAGLYWSTITMTTIGYGDIYPQSSIERIYVAIVSLISCGIFGYSISQIGEIVTELQKKQEIFDLKMQALNRLMNSRQMSKKLMYKVIKYHEYLHREDDSAIEELGRSMIDNLPKSMKETITYEMNYKLFYGQKIFALNYSKPFLDKLSIKVKHMKMGPETDLYQQGEIDNRLYFVNRGSLTLYFKQNEKEKICSTLKKGDMAGEIEFFSQCKRKFGVRSVSVVNLSFIEFEDFYSCLQSFSDDFESYNMMKDKIWFEGNLKPLDRKCESCGSFNHLFFDCNRLQYLPNTDKLIYKANACADQSRDSNFHRSQHKALNPLANFQQNSLPVHEYFNFLTTIGNGQEILNTSTSSIGQIPNPEDIQDPTTDDKRDLMSQSSHLRRQQSRSSVFDRDRDREMSFKTRSMRMRMKKPTFKVDIQIQDNSDITSISSSGVGNIDLQPIEQLKPNANGIITEPQKYYLPGEQQQQQQQQYPEHSNHQSSSNIKSLTQISSPKHLSLVPIQNNLQTSASSQLQNMQLQPPESQNFKHTHQTTNKNIGNFKSDLSIVQRGTRAISDLDGTYQTFQEYKSMIPPALSSNVKNNLHYQGSESQFPDQIEGLYSAQRGTKQQINLWLSNFELAKNYNIYFPHNNLEAILHKLKNIYLLKTRRQRKNKNGTPRTPLKPKHFDSSKRPSYLLI